MKKLFLMALILTILSGCGFNIFTPYGQIESETDSQIFTYTDADVLINQDGVKSDDTTVIIVGVKDNTGADLDIIFNHAMTQIKEIFETRGKIYRSWVKGE